VIIIIIKKIKKKKGKIKRIMIFISYVWIGGCWKYGCEVCCDEKGRLQLTPNREYTFLLNEDRIC
jgi:hypothetical protein